MNKIYFVKDKTGTGFKKLFSAICKTEAQAKQKVANLKNRLSLQAQGLISYDSFEVNDFDMNKSSVYIIYDKTDMNANKPIVGVHFDFVNAEKQLKALRNKKPLHVQKLIYAQMESLT